MATNPLIARIRGERPTIPRNAPTSALTTLVSPSTPVVSAVERIYGAARWPFAFLCMVKDWQRDLPTNTIKVEFASPEMAGRTWGARQTLAEWHLPYELGALVDPRESAMLLMLPANDPRTAATLDAMQRIWHD